MRSRPFVYTWQTAALIAVTVLVSLTPHLACAQIAVVGSSIDERTAAPGQRYDGAIVVRNLTPQPQPVLVYQTDYSFSADGTSRFDTPSTMRRSNAAWIVPAASSLVIPPLSDVTISYVVNVPTRDSLHGAFWSTLMLQGAPTAPPPTGARQVGIGAVVRYAVQIVTTLPSAVPRLVKITKTIAPAQVADTLARTRALDLVVENTGETAYRPLLWVELYDAAGTLRKRAEQQRGLLYPGTSVSQHFDFAPLPPGTYKAVVFADTGDDTVSAAQYKLVF